MQLTEGKVMLNERIKSAKVTSCKIGNNPRWRASSHPAMHRPFAGGDSIKLKKIFAVRMPCGRRMEICYSYRQCYLHFKCAAWLEAEKILERREAVNG